MRGLFLHLSLFLVIGLCVLVVPGLAKAANNLSTCDQFPMACADFTAPRAPDASNWGPMGGLEGQNGNPGKTLADFGPYYPAPGGQDTSLYQVQYTPWSSTAAPEMTDFGCNYPSESGSQYAGTPIPGSVQQKLRNDFADTRDKYNQAIDDGKSPDYAKGIILADTKLWAAQDPANVKPLITVTGDPGALPGKVPVGCDLGETDNLPTHNNLTFSNLIRKPDRFITSLVLFVPGDLVSGIYREVEPRALAYSFWTPHSERGWTAPFPC